MFINQELLPRNFSAVYIDLGSPVVYDFWGIGKSGGKPQ